MSVRFVIGRAGTGKTHHCLTSIREHIQSSPVNGPPLVMLVPEQASMQMERLLLAPPIRAVARAQVLSFTRLAQRILIGTIHQKRESLSATARSMVLRRITGKLGSGLRYYRRVERFSNFFERIGRTLGEFIEEAIEPSDLARISAELGDDPQRQAKFADLSAIYQAYLGFLGDRYCDPTQYLEIAGEHLLRQPLFAGASIWVDGFAGFTGSQIKLLISLAEQAANLEITLLMDAAELAATAPATDFGMFAKPVRTYARLKRSFDSHGVEIEDPRLLSAELPRRFRASRDLAALEKAICTRRAFSDESLGSEDIHIAGLADQRSEVEFAVAQVCSLVSKVNKGYRYRDIAIIVRNLDPYHDLLASALTDRGIPYFIDRRRTITHHAAVEFVRALLAVAANDFSVESVRLLIKSGLTGLDDEQGDELENYVLACGISGRERWCETDWSFDARGETKRDADEHDVAVLRRVNITRRTLLDGFEPLVEPRDSLTGISWIDAIRKVLTNKRLAEKVEAWAIRADEDGRVAQAAEHRQIWVEIESFLDEFEHVLGDQAFTIAELRAVIEAGLSQLTLGLVPPTVDQVLVGSIERSRHPELKAVILLGFNEGTFPQIASEDAIVNDDDREALDRCGLTLGVTRKQSILDEKLLVYVALTRPSQKLLLTYSNADVDGKALRPSSFVEELIELLPNVQVRQYGSSISNRAMWSILNIEDLATAIAFEMRHRPKLEHDDVASRTEWNDLYSLARSTHANDRRIWAAVSAFANNNAARLDEQSVRALIRPNWTTSVSELEAVARCPFQRFAKYDLKLQERRDASLKVTDLGTVQHAVLEEFINDSVERNEAFAKIDGNEVRARLDTIVKRLSNEWTAVGRFNSARDEYLLNRSSTDLAPIIKAQQQASSSGDFAPRSTEKKFGFSNDPTSLPPLEINTPKGRLVRLRGVIDRVDLAAVADEFAAVVVDYKRSADKRLEISSVQHGLSLQLLGYLLVLAEHGPSMAGKPVKPMGAFYVSLLHRYKLVEHPSLALDDGIPPAPKPRGIVDFDRIEFLEKEGPTSRWSDRFQVYRKADGSHGNVDTSDGATSHEFNMLLDHTRRMLGELSDRVLDGTITVSPYRKGTDSPCSWCDFRAVCRFEFGQDPVRYLKRSKKSQVFKQLEVRE